MGTSNPSTTKLKIINQSTQTPEQNPAAKASTRGSHKQSIPRIRFTRELAAAAYFNGKVPKLFGDLPLQ